MYNTVAVIKRLFACGIDVDVVDDRYPEMHVVGSTTRVTHIVAAAA